MANKKNAINKIILCLLIALSTCSAAQLKIASSSNLQNALKELKKEYEKNSTDTLKITIAASSVLAMQIKNGAKYDIFLSADERSANLLHVNQIAKNRPKEYARGELVLCGKSINQNTDITKTLQKAQKIAIANPKTAPYGKASIEVLKNLKIFEQAKSKLIKSSSISATMLHIKNGADVGFCAYSLYANTQKSNFKKIPKNLYNPIRQTYVVLNDNPQTQKFAKFLGAPKALQILKKHGYDTKHVQSQNN